MEPARSPHCIPHVPLFDGIDSASEEKLFEAATRKSFKRDQMLFHQGQQADTLRIISHGKVKLVDYDSSGKEHIQEILHDGDAIGEQLFLTSMYKYPFSAICLTDCELFQIPGALFQKELDGNPALMRSVARSVGQKLVLARRRNLLLVENDAMARVAACMLQQDDHCLNHEISLGIDDLAALINLRRETISRKLGQLVKEGIVVRLGQNKLKVADREKLLAYASGRDSSES